jgi:GTP cyclohydrolase IA
MAIDRRAAERAIADFLRALGRDPESDPELRETPARATEAFADELLSGYQVDVGALIAGGSSALAPGGHHGIVVVRDIDVATVCPHHLLPALGRACVAYRPARRLLGLGVIARLVDAFARRLTLQEVIGERVVATLLAEGGAIGGYCAIELTHGCLSARGARQHGASVRTVARGGDLAGSEGAAELALALPGSESTRTPAP